MKKPTPILNPNATEAERAAYWASLTKAQRVAFLRAQSGPLYTTSAERMSAVAALKKAGA